MAGVLEEFDEATPLRGTFCSRVSAEEYEEQGSQCTEQALTELLNHLDENPEMYKKVVQKRKRQEAEEAGLLSYMKVKLWSLWAGEDAGYSVSDSECEENLEKLKKDMIKAFDYSQENKGRRFSKRLAEKRLRVLRQSQPKSTLCRATKRHSENLPPVPPPPPLPCTPHLYPTLMRRPLSERKAFMNTAQQEANSKSVDSGSYKNLLQQLKGSGGRRKLRRTEERSPGGTPLCGWPSRGNCEPDMMPYFNTRLLEKFQNTRSPVPSLNIASPGTFESPL